MGTLDFYEVYVDVSAQYVICINSKSGLLLITYTYIIIIMAKLCDCLVAMYLCMQTSVVK